MDKVENSVAEMETDGFETLPSNNLKTPLRAEEEKVHAPGVWYVIDAEGNKLAITNAQSAPAFVEAVNYVRDLEINQSALLKQHADDTRRLVQLLIRINFLETSLLEVASDLHAVCIQDGREIFQSEIAARDLLVGTQS